MYTDDNGIVRFESLDNVAPLQVGLNAALESVSNSMAVVYSASVVAISPLSIQLDGESAPYDGTVIDTVGQLVVGDDIRVLVQQGTATVVGRVGGLTQVESTDLQAYVDTSFPTRTLTGWTDGHTVYLHGMLGSGSIAQGGDDITGMPLPAAWRPGVGNWQGACWVSGGHPAIAFARAGGSISVVQRSGGTVAAAQFLISFPKIN